MIQICALFELSMSVNTCQHTLSYALRYVPIPPSSKQKLWVFGDASFAPTGEKSQQGIVVYHGITSNTRDAW